MDKEEKINKFLQGFFEYNYPRKKELFEYLPSIYALMSFLENNMQTIEKDIELNSLSRINLIEAENLINGYYKSIGIEFKLEDIIKDGTFDLIGTNDPKEATHHELTYGNNNYIGEHKSISVYNNGLVTDTIIWIHEISHYRNQPKVKRGKVNDMLTELLAFTEEFLYMDYLEKRGYKKEAELFRIEEYQNLHKFIKIGVPFIKIYLTHFLLGNVSKENFEYLYREGEIYDKHLEHFEKIVSQNQDAIFNILWYSIGIISIYNYEKYKENYDYLNKIKELNEKIMTDISLEEALKIMDITLDEESLHKILQRINNFKDRITLEENSHKIHQ